MKKTKLIIVLLSLLFLSAIIPKNLLQTKADAATKSDYVLVTKLDWKASTTKDPIYEIYADSDHYDASNKTIRDGASIKAIYLGPSSQFGGTELPLT